LSFGYFELIRCSHAPIHHLRHHHTGRSKVPADWKTAIALTGRGPVPYLHASVWFFTTVRVAVVWAGGKKEGGGTSWPRYTCRFPEQIWIRPRLVGKRTPFFSPPPPACLTGLLSLCCLPASPSNPHPALALRLAPSPPAALLRWARSHILTIGLHPTVPVRASK